LAGGGGVVRVVVEPSAYVVMVVTDPSEFFSVTVLVIWVGEPELVLEEEEEDELLSVAPTGLVAEAGARLADGPPVALIDMVLAPG